MNNNKKKLKATKNKKFKNNKLMKMNTKTKKQ